MLDMVLLNGKLLAWLLFLMVGEGCYIYLSKERNGIVFTREGSEVDLSGEQLEGNTFTVRCANSYEVSIQQLLFRTIVHGKCRRV